MPITQDRFLTVIRGAKQLLEKQQSLIQSLQQNWEQDIVIANTVVDHTTDDHARDAILLLLNRINILRDILAHNDATTIELTAIVLAEEIHFQRNGKRNERSAQYRQWLRQQQGIMPRQVEHAINPPPISSPPITEPLSDIENTPGFKKFQADMLKSRQNANIANPTTTTTTTKGTLLPRNSDKEITRYLPSDEELYAMPDTIGKNVL